MECVSEIQSKRDLEGGLVQKKKYWGEEEVKECSKIRRVIQGNEFVKEKNNLEDYDECNYD